MNYDAADLVRKWNDADEAASFRLCTVALDGTQTPIDLWPKQLGATEIAEALEEVAAHHANALGGTHAFILQALGTDGRTVLASHAFRVSAEAMPGAGVLLSEPANAGGILAQTQRHQEAIMQSTVLAWDRLMRGANNMIERADRRAAKSEHAYMRMVDLHAEMVERHEERKAESIRRDKMLEIKADSAKKLTALAPVALEAIVKRAAPEGLDRATAYTARTLFESFKENQLVGVLAQLDTEQQQVLMHLFKQLATAAESEKAAATEGDSDAKH